jgi:beta-galactosidase
MNSDPRPVLDLAGTWECADDPDDLGLSERWSDPNHRFGATITVPGAWNVQGFALDPERLDRWERSRAEADQPLRDRGLLGTEPESQRQHHVHPGPIWYRRTITLPPDWSPDRTELVLDGVQRSATVWCGSEEVATVVAAVVPSAIDLTRQAAPGATLTLTMRVDARRDPVVDPWWGCRDTLDFLFLNWGGLHGPVRLVGSPATRISSVGVTTDLTAGEVRWVFDLEVDNAHPPGHCTVTLTDPETGTVMADMTVPVAITPEGSDTRPGLGSATAVMAATGLRLWSPADPFLYAARVAVSSGSIESDQRSVRVGVRELSVDDHHLMLNGLPFFARGYGDDCIFPDTIAPPHDVATYRARFELARELGFNWVRLHSWVPPEAMLEAADEVGMLVQPELPIGLTWEPPLPSTYDVVRARWRELILRYRHHPSIAVWCQGNELYDSHPLAQELYTQAKELDPGRLVIESDGTRSEDAARATLDFAVVQFAEGASIGIDGGKYDIDVATPVIAHEVGYFATLPDPGEISRFGHGIRPYWLHRTAALIADRGWEDSYPAMLDTSRALQRSCLKINTEALRDSQLTGMSHWLLHDYPACAEGIVDMFGGSKGCEPEWMRQFNADTVPLAPGLARNHVSGADLVLTPVVSCWQHPLPLRATLTASITDRSGLESDTVDLQVAELTVTEVRHRCEPIRLRLPVVDVVTHVQLQLTVAGSDLLAENQWDLWIHPEPAPSSGHPVHVAPAWTPDVLRRLRDGERVVVLDPTGAVDADRCAYRPAAWDGAGHHGLTFDPQHPALAPLRASGWCDERFYRVVEGGRIMAVEQTGADHAIIVRAIDRPDRLADRALLAEYAYGPGRLLLSGFRLDSSTIASDPGARTLLAALVDYAGSSAFSPRTTL